MPTPSTYTTGYIDDDLYARLYPAFESLARRSDRVQEAATIPVDPLLPLRADRNRDRSHRRERSRVSLPGALSPKEAIPDLLAVIRMHTINSAYQMHMEHVTGSIEVGKYADLVVLSQNLFEVPTEQISDTKIQTILGGEVVYDAAAGIADRARVS